MPFKPGAPVDPAISFHPLRGDLARLRALAERDGTSVAAVLRGIVHGYLGEGRPGDVRPPGDDIDALAERLGGGA